MLHPQRSLKVKVSYKWISETVRLWDMHYTFCEVVQLKRALKTANVILFLKPIALKIYILFVSQKSTISLLQI
jgi:hypothetical protein